MLWTKLDDKWTKRKDLADGQSLEGGITFKTEQWEVPGDQPLPVRVCTNRDAPLSKYSQSRTTEKTSIVLHLTAGYGNFSCLMGQSDHAESAHFVLGRDGFAYQCVPTEMIAWHATWWNENSVGIEIDNIANLREHGDSLISAYGTNDVYCKKSDTGVFVEKSFRGIKYWAAFTEVQYQSLGRLIKAISHKHKIPLMVLPEESRFKPFNQKGDDRKKFRGVCTHLQIDPANRADIGPYIDWARVIQLGNLTEGDCFNAPPYQPPGAPKPADKPSSAAAPAPAAEAPKPAEKPAAAAPAPAPKPAETPSTPSKLTWEQVEQKVLQDEYKLVGDYTGANFVDNDLQLLLKHYCDEEKLDPGALGSDGLPAWLTKWRERIGGGTNWDKSAQGRAGVAEAYCRAKMRDLCKENGIPYSPAADEFFAEMYKSEKNGQQKDMVGMAPRKPAPKEPPPQEPSKEDPKPADAGGGTKPADAGGGTTAAGGDKPKPKPKDKPEDKPPAEDKPKPAGTPGKTIKSSNITVGGAPFPDWYNANVATIKDGKKFFPKCSNKKKWAEMFDHCADLYAPELTVKQFVAIFMIMSNETGGSYTPVGEYGYPKELPMKYFFEAGKKQSYNNNGGNRGAGDQLKAKGLIGDEDVAKWNGKVWPSDVGPDHSLIPALKECDFNKYRGHGLIQTTFRTAYHVTVDPILQKLGKPNCDDMSCAELENLILTNPAVYLGMVNKYFHAGNWKVYMANLDAAEPKDVCKASWPCHGQSPWFNIGYHVSGGKAYAELYEWRTTTLYEHLQADGIECR